MGRFLVRSFLERLLPFILLGIMIVLGVVGIVLFSYLLIFGALIGLILFIVAWVQGLFQSKQKKASRLQQKRGRIIDHDNS